MNPVPPVRTPAGPGARLMTGRALNAMLASLRSRTILNAAQAASAGHSGVSSQGGTAVPALARGRYEPGRVYVTSPAFWATFHAALQSRHGLSDPLTPPSELHSGTAGLQTASRTVQRLTPTSPIYSGPDGYRLASSEREARLCIEVQQRRAFGRACYYILADPVEDGYVTVRTDILVYDNGTVTQTVTASGAVERLVDGDVPDDCADLVYTDDTDPDFDYGAAVSSETNETLVEWNAAASAASSSPADYDLPTETCYAWQETEWRVASENAAFDHFLEISRSGVASSPFGAGSLWIYVRPKFRFQNNGGATLKLNWDWTENAGPGEVLSELTLHLGQTSDWFEAPAPANFSEWTGFLRRVRIGPY